MRITDVKKLQPGDEVFWTDPDEDACSGIYKIQTIEFVPPNMVRIMEPDGSVLECYARELS
jgi:hypothetical protein